MTSPIEVVERFLEAANDGDPDEVAACVHEDFESGSPQRPSRNFTGNEQVRKNWALMYETTPDFHVELLRSAVEGNEVWVELRATGTSAETGDPVEVAAVFIMAVDGEKVKRARIYSEEVVHDDETVDEWMEGIYDKGRPDPP